MLGHKILFDHAMAEAKRLPSKRVLSRSLRSHLRRRSDEERAEALAA